MSTLKKFHNASKEISPKNIKDDFNSVLKNRQNPTEKKKRRRTEKPLNVKKVLVQFYDKIIKDCNAITDSIKDHNQVVKDTSIVHKNATNTSVKTKLKDLRKSDNVESKFQLHSNFDLCKIVKDLSVNNKLGRKYMEPSPLQTECNKRKNMHQKKIAIGNEYSKRNMRKTSTKSEKYDKTARSNYSTRSAVTTTAATITAAAAAPAPATSPTSAINPKKSTSTGWSPQTLVSPGVLSSSSTESLFAENDHNNDYTGYKSFIDCFENETVYSAQSDTLIQSNTINFGSQFSRVSDYGSLKDYESIKECESEYTTCGEELFDYGYLQKRVGGAAPPPLRRSSSAKMLLHFRQLLEQHTLQKDVEGAKRQSILNDDEVEFLRNLVEADQRYRYLKREDHNLLKDILEAQLKQIECQERILEEALRKLREKSESSKNLNEKETAPPADNKKDHKAERKETAEKPWEQNSENGQDTFEDAEQMNIDNNEINKISHRLISHLESIEEKSEKSSTIDDFKHYNPSTVIYEPLLLNSDRKVEGDMSLSPRSTEPYKSEIVVVNTSSTMGFVYEETTYLEPYELLQSTMNNENGNIKIIHESGNERCSSPIMDFMLKDVNSDSFKQLFDSAIMSSRSPVNSARTNCSVKTEESERVEESGKSRQNKRDSMNSSNESSSPNPQKESTSTQTPQKPITPRTHEWCEILLPQSPKVPSSPRSVITTPNSSHNPPPAASHSPETVSFTQESQECKTNLSQSPKLLSSQQSACDPIELDWTHDVFVENILDSPLSSPRSINTPSSPLSPRVPNTSPNSNISKSSSDFECPIEILFRKSPRKGAFTKAANTGGVEPGQINNEKSEKSVFIETPSCKQKPELLVETDVSEEYLDTVQELPEYDTLPIVQTFHNLQEFASDHLQDNTVINNLINVNEVKITEIIETVEPQIKSIDLHNVIIVHYSFCEELVFPSLQIQAFYVRNEVCLIQKFRVKYLSLDELKSAGDFYIFPTKVESAEPERTNFDKLQADPETFTKLLTLTTRDGKNESSAEDVGDGRIQETSHVKPSDEDIIKNVMCCFFQTWVACPEMYRRAISSTTPLPSQGDEIKQMIKEIESEESIELPMVYEIESRYLSQDIYNETICDLIPLEQRKMIQNVIVFLAQFALFMLLVLCLSMPDFKCEEI